MPIHPHTYASFRRRGRSYTYMTYKLRAIFITLYFSRTNISLRNTRAPLRLKTGVYKYACKFDRGSVQRRRFDIRILRLAYLSLLSRRSCMSKRYTAPRGSFDARACISREHFDVRVKVVHTHHHAQSRVIILVHALCASAHALSLCIVLQIFR